MTRTVNIDSPPKGPIRWRWVTSAFASLLRAAGIISPDESVNIDATTGGFTLSQDTPPSSAGIEIKDLGEGIYEVPEISVTASALDSVTIPKQKIAIPTQHILCVKIEYQLAGFVMDQPAIFSQNLASGDINGTGSITLVAVPISGLSSAQAAIPGVSASGTIYLPIAANEAQFRVFVNSTTFQVIIYHGGFTFNLV
jgi:hypothetical protein